MRRILGALLAALAALSVMACTLGPKYVRPKVDVPQTWRTVPDTEAASVANTPWWDLFQDPVLQDLIRQALEGNKDLAIAIERIEEARARYGFVKADSYPRLDLQASSGRGEASESIGLPVGAGDERSLHSVFGAVSWELDFFGRVRKANEAERSRLLATEYARRVVVITLVSDVARAYVELRDFDRRLQISRDTLESRRVYQGLARDRFEGGLTSELDMRQAEAELFRTQALTHDFERLVAERENEISVLLGRNPGPITRGVAEPMGVPPEIPPGLPSDLLERRPDILEAEELLHAATADIGQAKALLFPRIALTGAYGWESSDLGDLFDSPANAWNVAANLLQPIFNAGKNRRRVRLTESVQRQTLYAYEKQVLVAFQEVEDSLVGYRSAGQQRDAQGERVRAERTVLDLADLRYRGGVAAYLDVLDSQRELFDAELDEAQSVRDQYVSLIRLYKSLGGGWPDDPSSQPVAPPKATTERLE